MAEAYKLAILLYWRFIMVEKGKSSDKICQLFLNYLEKDDFVGAYMAYKFLQMVIHMQGDMLIIKAEKI